MIKLLILIILDWLREIRCTACHADSHQLGLADHALYIHCPICKRDSCGIVIG